MGKKKILAGEEKKLVLPLLALENQVLTPFIPQPVKIDNEKQKEFLDNHVTNNSEIFVTTSAHVESASEEPQIMKYGIVGVVDRVLQMPGSPTLAFIRPICCAKITGGITNNGNFETVEVAPLKNINEPKKISDEAYLLIERIEELLRNVMHFVGDPEKTTAEKLIHEHSFNPLIRIYAIIHVAPAGWEEKYPVLECRSFLSLLKTTALMLDQTEQRISLQAAIHEKTHRELSQQQKETFLRVHLKQIKEELGEVEDNDISDLIIKANKKNWSKETQKHFDKELQKLRRLNINNPEYSVQYSYLEAFLDLPWQNYNNEKFSLDKVEEILNRDHYGLEKVKERILEYMAVVKLRDDLKAPIICLYGPPGVGKTSIGKSVAEATGREYARISLGGMHDEAEIRGHRRTYIGAMPGRFLHSLSKLKFGNPLILLDEIDKVGKDFKGDPSSALLEALDPEQNFSFHDNFIDYPYDLSKVLFIATANDLSTIPPPLRDRMEIIEMEAYKPEEKHEIAVRHLVKQALSENGFKENEVKFSPEAIDTIIKSFTHEAGVRQLKMQISRVIRKLALMKVKGKKLPDEITGKLVTEFLDKKDNWHNRLGFRG